MSNDEIKIEDDEQNINDLELVVNEIKGIHNLIKDDLQKQQEQNKYKDETINRLQKVVYDYEQGFIKKIKEPLIKDLILFKDSFDKFKEMFQEASSTLIKEIDFLEEELSEIMYSHGVEVLTNENETYDRNVQIVKKKEACDNPELDKTIKKVLKKGYTLDGKILRKEEIAINIYQENNK